MGRAYKFGRCGRAAHALGWLGGLWRVLRRAGAAIFHRRSPVEPSHDIFAGHEPPILGNALLGRWRGPADAETRQQSDDDNALSDLLGRTSRRS